MRMIQQAVVPFYGFVFDLLTADLKGAQRNN